MDSSNGGSNSSLESLFLKIMQQPEISTAVPSCDGDKIDDTDENVASSSVDPKTESFEEMMDRVIRELRAKDNNGSLQTLFLNIMSGKEIKDIDPKSNLDYGNGREPPSPFPFCPRANKHAQNSAAATLCNHENCCDPHEKKVSFSQLEAQVTDIASSSIGVPETESFEEIPDRAIRKLRAKDADKKMESFEDRIDRIIRELRMKDDHPQETFPPCVAHGLAVRMDTISRSLTRLENDLGVRMDTISRSLTRLENDLGVRMDTISLSLTRLENDVTEMKNNFARVLDQQDLILKNLNHNRSQRHSNKQRQRWQNNDNYDDDDDIDDDNNDNNNDDDGSPVERDESNNDGLPQVAPSQLDVMMMMLGQSNNIFYSRQPSTFFRAGSETGCCIQPGPYCHRPITPPSQIVSIEEETLDEENNNINKNHAACMSPRSPVQMYLSKVNDNNDHPEKAVTTAVSVD